MRHVTKSQTQTYGLMDSVALKLLNKRNSEIVLENVNSESLVLQLNLNRVRVVLI